MSERSAGHNGERFNARYWDTATDAPEVEAMTIPAYRAPPGRANLGDGERP